MDESYKVKLRTLAVHKATGSVKETAQRLGIAESTVRIHVKWAETHGMLDKDKSVMLEHRIAELNDRQDKINDIWQREYQRLDRLYAKSEANDSADDHKLPFRIRDTFVPLTQELRENQVLLMELQGLYKQTVQTQITNNTTNVLVLPNKANDDEWARMVKEVLGESLTDSIKIAERPEEPVGFNLESGMLSKADQLDGF